MFPLPPCQASVWEAAMAMWTQERVRGLRLWINAMANELSAARSSLGMQHEGAAHASPRAFLRFANQWANHPTRDSETSPSRFRARISGGVTAEPIATKNVRSLG